jgi:hypothetical protein
MAQVFGKAFISANGKRLRSMAGAKLDLGGFERQVVKGSAQVHGHSETVKEATVECEIALARGDKLEDIRNLTDATITFECDSGQTYVIRDAFLTDTLSMSEGEGGKIPVKFAGQPAEEA